MSSVRARSQALLALVAGLLLLSIISSHLLGHDRRMPDQPMYRWRESLSIALSRMHSKPLHGYLAYRSIVDYFAKNGLGVWLSDPAPWLLTNPSEYLKLVHDPQRMEGLFEGALNLQVDESLAPVPLRGNERGLADFYYLAFKLFGLHVSGFMYLYYLLLATSTLAFFYTFKNSPFAILLLSLYLIVHFYMVLYYLSYCGPCAAGAAPPPFLDDTVHNSRFFPVLSVLPALHLLLLALQKCRLSPANLCCGLLQTFILFFVAFCRIQAIWQILPVIVVIAGSLMLTFLRSVARDRKVTAKAFAVSRPFWPLILAIAGLTIFAVYSRLALDARYYAAETTAHVFWHPLYSGTVSPSPELQELYNHSNVAADSDQAVYDAVMDDLRERKVNLNNPNELGREIMFLYNGQIYIDPSRNMGIYDELVRRLFFTVVHDHPWLVLKSFLFDKFVSQLEIFATQTPVGDLRSYQFVLLLWVGATLVALAAGLSAPTPDELRTGAATCLVTTLGSTVSILIVPSVHNIDCVAAWMIMVLFIAAYAALEFRTLFDFRAHRQKPR
jgi:hypothetical protein